MRLSYQADAPYGDGKIIDRTARHLLRIMVNKGTMSFNMRDPFFFLFKGKVSRFSFLT
jgi:hypothetical protein